MEGNYCRMRMRSHCWAEGLSPTFQHEELTPAIRLKRWRWRDPSCNWETIRNTKHLPTASSSQQKWQLWNEVLSVQLCCRSAHCKAPEKGFHPCQGDISEMRNDRIQNSAFVGREREGEINEPTVLLKGILQAPALSPKSRLLNWNKLNLCWITSVWRGAFEGCCVHSPTASQLPSHGLRAAAPSCNAILQLPMRF